MPAADGRAFPRPGAGCSARPLRGTIAAAAADVTVSAAVGPVGSIIPTSGEVPPPPCESPGVEDADDAAEGCRERPLEVPPPRLERAPEAGAETGGNGGRSAPIGMVFAAPGTPPPSVLRPPPGERRGMPLLAARPGPCAPLPVRLWEPGTGSCRPEKLRLRLGVAPLWPRERGATGTEASEDGS